MSSIINASILIREEPSPEDIVKIRRILVSTDVFLPFEIDIAQELIEDRLQKGKGSDYRFLFADIPSETAGYICFGHIPMTRKRFDIYWIGVKKALQGLGIGHLLMSRAEETIKTLGGEYLFVETSSRDIYEPTRRFYIRHAFQEVARIPCYYSENDDKVVFMKHLARNKT